MTHSRTATLPPHGCTPQKHSPPCRSETAGCKVGGYLVLIRVKEWTQFVLRNILAGLAQNGAQSSRIQFLMAGNRQGLLFTCRANPT